MNIPLNILENKRLTADAIFYGPKRILGYVKFHIDTGSHLSFISHEDIKRMNIPFDKFEYTEKAIIGGTLAHFANIGKVKIAFRTEDINQKSIFIDVPKFYLAHGIYIKGLEGHAYPSILGLDFLKLTGTKLFVDMKNNKACFEL